MPPDAIRSRSSYRDEPLSASADRFGAFIARYRHRAPNEPVLSQPLYRRPHAARPKAARAGCLPPVAPPSRRNPYDDATATLVRDPKPRPLAATVRVALAGAATFHLRAGKCVVGSAQSCDVVIQEPTVSRGHAELELVA